MSTPTESSSRTAMPLELMMTEKRSDAPRWSAPESFDLSTQGDRDLLEQRFREGEVESVRDELELIAHDLFEMEHPDKKIDTEERAQFVESITSQGIDFGTWFRMPWNKELIRYPDKDEFRNLRTFRNRNLVTADEQSRLYDSKVAVFGLSVGSKVVEQLVVSGIGGTVIIGDPDHITPSNLNRIEGGMSDVGMKKIHRIARKISTVDPYVQQVHFEDGVTAANLDTLATVSPDIIFDEVDDLHMKANMREFAQMNKVPLVMATDLGDRSIIDVERYDIENIAPFRGLIKGKLYDKLLDGSCTPEELKHVTKRIVGIRHVTTRMIESVVEIDKTLAGMPQLGDTAAVGGGLASKVAREILLGRKVKTGRYVVNPKQTLGLDAQATVRQGLRAIRTVQKFGK